MHYGKVEVTEKCVKHLLACRPNPWIMQVVIIDNTGKKVLQHKLLPDTGTGLHIISNDANKGYAAALNCGYHWSRSIGAKYCLFINNDLQLLPEALEKLYYAVQTIPTAGLWSGMITFQNQPDKLWFAGGKIQPALCRTRHFHDPKKRKGDFISGALMLVDCDVFNKTGLFETDYFLYFEDADLCLRSRIAGYLPYTITEVIARHDIGAIDKNDYTSDYLYYQTRNRRYFFLRYGGRFYQIYFQVVNLFCYVLLRSTLVLLYSSTGRKINNCRAIFSGYWHSLKNIKNARPVVR